MNRRQLMIVFWLMLLSLMILGTLVAPITAQDGVPILATNTPSGTSGIVLATNTPVGSASTSGNEPDAPLERYALRLWDEAALVSLLLDNIKVLTPGDQERILAVQLLQAELGRRFPGAPRDSGLRDQLLAAMLAAPRGSVDMRDLVRGRISTILNQTQPLFDRMSSLDADGFGLTIMPFRLDIDTFNSAVIHTVYPAGATDPADVLYEDYTLAQIDSRAQYQLMTSSPAYPAAPFGNIESIKLERIDDLTDDFIDELAVSVQYTGEVNHEMFIFGERGGVVVNLVLPGQSIRFGGITDWPLDGSNLVVSNWRVASDAWSCLEERDISWSWNANFFRSSADLPAFTFQPRLGCLLYGSEPLYELPVAEAISTIEGILPLAQADDIHTTQRAGMMLAMLHVLEGRADLALAQVEALIMVAEPGSWLETQITAFTESAAASNTTPIQICAALQRASQYGSCDVDQVLTRLFNERPLQADTNLETQLAALGISILNSVTISEVGKFDREALQFNLPSPKWWAFSLPTRAETYTAELIDPPAGYSPTPPPVELILLPAAALETFLLNNDPARTLVTLDNAALQNPNAPVDYAAQFLRMLSYDLVGSRDEARRGYYALWRAAPDTIWGQLAGAHLERR